MIRKTLNMKQIHERERQLKQQNPVDVRFEVQEKNNPDILEPLLALKCPLECEAVIKCPRWNTVVTKEEIKEMPGIP